MTPAFDILFSGPFMRAMLTNFFFFSSLNAYVLLPLYVQRLGGSEAAIGLVQGMYSAAGILSQPLIGHWIDRLGRRFFMLVGVTISMVTCMAFVVTSSIPALALLRAIQGIGFSAFFVANYIHVVELVPLDRRGWALGIFGVSGMLSTSLAPLVGEFLIRRFGFAWFFAGSVVFAAATLPLVWGVRDTPRPAAPAVGLLEAFRQGLAELLRLHMALMFFFGLGTGTVFTFMPTFAEFLGVRGLGLFYTAYAVAAMLVRVVAGDLIDTRGRRAVIIPSMLAQAAATCTLALVAIFAGPSSATPALPFLFVAGLMAGGAHGFLYPALSALLMDVTPEARRGSAVGTFSAVFLVGNALGSMMFGYVAHALGYGVMWSLLTMLLAAGFAMSLRLRIGFMAAGATS